MLELEILEIPALRPDQESRLELHSLLNLYNVLIGELTVLGLVLGEDDRLLRRSLAVCDQLLGNLGDQSRALEDAEHLEENLRVIAGEIDAAILSHAARAGHSEVIQSRRSLRTVWEILRIRALELLARRRTPGRWERIPVAQLRRNFTEVFAGVEQHSRGRYRIVYNAALQGPEDYYFDFEVDSNDHEAVRMPPIFEDVMRDLAANARKYTAPGGSVTVSLYGDPEMLRLVVRDSGRGIAPDELARVVRFGERGSNVGPVRSLGGGLGLTKAFWATKQFEGRFWIASQPGVGTTVRIQVPVPVRRGAQPCGGEDVALPAAAEALA